VNKPNPVRVQGELYTSPAFVDAHQELQDSPAEPGCNLPRVIAALMFWSDATHLTAFGNAKLWPLYMNIPLTNLEPLLLTDSHNNHVRAGDQDPCFADMHVTCRLSAFIKST
jgi:hypothetical protein